ncbi:unnamed protein product, partial [Closterium sp. NIES-53]
EGKCVLFEAAEIEQWEMQMAAMAEAQRHNQRAAPPLGADGRPLLARRCPNCRQFNHKEGRNNDMHCRNCRTRFCGMCNQIMRNVYHFRPNGCRQHTDD